MTEHDTDRPGTIHARPVRHPGRWVALALIAVAVAMLVNSAVTNKGWGWGKAFEMMVQKPVLEGIVKGTLVGTLGAMIIGVSLGVVLAVLRLSGNPILRAVSFAFTWFFRSIPRYVLLAAMGSLGYLYPVMDLGIPFGTEIAGFFGSSSALSIAQFDVNQLSSTLIFGIIGLGISEAAYMSEIARAGIVSVDQGQTEAAQALGMGPGKTMRRIVLPQAMRVIVPPTGNEMSAMVKDTSLLGAIPVITELFYQVRAIGVRTLLIFPSYVAACLWYLIICSVLMVAQHYIERYFGRGFGPTPKVAKQKLMKIGADH